MTETGASPLITVIIPTYNSSGTLGVALETVLRQSFADFEVWVVGDGCTDDSATVARSFGDRRVHWVNLPHNSGGPSQPRNEALRRARGSLIAYLGHDDLWFPWHLAELANHLESSGDDFACSPGVNLGPEGAVSTFTLPTRPWDLRSGVSPSNWVHRKSLAEAVGPWSTDLKTSHDREFLQRVVDSKASVGCRSRLSVLRFPSGIWRMYALSGDLPQIPYARALDSDPADLESRLLAQVQDRLSRSESPPGRRDRLLSLPKNVARRLIIAAGPDRWPLNHLLYRYWRHRSGLSRNQ